MTRYPVWMDEKVTRCDACHTSQPCRQAVLQGDFVWACLDYLACVRRARTNRIGAYA